MNSRLVLALVLAAAVIAVLLFAFQASQNSGLAVLPSEKPEALKLGWMTSWADAGLMAESLKNTEIPKQNNAGIELVSFNYGPPLVEAALSKKIDAAFTGWVPAVNLLAKDNDWVVVGRLVSWKTYFIVGLDSGISEIAGLKGKKIAVAYASGPYPLVVMELQKAGFTIGKDVELVNMPPTNMPLALETRQVDAVVWVEPIFTQLTQKKIGKTIATFEDTGFIIVSKKYLEENPENARNFLKAVKEAFLFAAQNRQKAIEWYVKDSGFDLKLVESLDIIEPNYNAQSIGQVDLSLKNETLEEIQKKIDFEFREGIISKPVNISEHVDLSFLEGG